jgi:hypothetical protein
MRAKSDNVLLVIALVAYICGHHTVALVFFVLWVLD